MDNADFDARWGDFMTSNGVQIEEDVLRSFQESRHLLNIDDGTHASWYGDRLGVLLVFQRPEAEAMVGGWQDASGGDLIALSRVLGWVTGFVEMLEQCLTLYDFTEE